jgi:mitogen-activated protein kinase organizer 1
LAASGNSVVVTDLVTARPLRTLTGHTGVVNAVAMTPELYLSASYDGTVRIWDAKSRSAIQTMKEATDSVTSVMVRANNVITGSVDGMVRTYNVQTGQLHCDNVGSPVVSMDMSKDGLCVVVATLEGDLIFMDAGTGQLLNTYDRTHRAGKYALQCCVTANDASILTGSEDGRAVLYDVVQGTMVQSLEGHLRPTCAVAAHPKRSDVVVTASYDGTAVVWAHEASSFMQMNVD